MPKLNRRGDWCAGIGGGVASVNGLPLAMPAGGTSWIDDERVVYQVCDAERCRLEIYNTRTGTKTVALDHGANFIAANGGVWAAWFGTDDPNLVGITTSYGARFPASGLGPVGPDGSLALKVDYQSSGPWDVVELDGSRWRLTDGDAGNINLLGTRRAVWSEPGGALKANLMPVPAVITVPFYWLKVVLAAGEYWVLYQTDDGRLVLHPFSSSVGYVVTQGNAYRPDMCALANGQLRVVWALSEGEPPHDIRTADLDLASPRLELRSFLSPPSLPPPSPEEPLPVDTFPDIFPIVQAVRARYPPLLTPDLAVACLNEIAQTAGEDWGLLRKDGGNHGQQPGTGIFCSCDWIVHKPSGKGCDCFTAGPDSTANPIELGKATAQWNDAGEPFALTRFVESVSVGLPLPTPIPTPTPKPSGPSLDAWIHQEFPTLVAEFKRKRPELGEPGNEWAAFQTYRRYVEGWSFDRVFAEV